MNLRPTPCLRRRLSPPSPLVRTEADRSAGAVVLRADDVSFAYPAQRGPRARRRIGQRRARRSRRHHRTERLGQDDAAETARRDARAGVRVGFARRPAARPTGRAARSRGASPYVPQETHASFDFTVLDIVLMGRFPHLGTFALEGPEDLAIARAGARGHGRGAFEERPFAHAERRRKTARGDRQRAGPESRSCCCSTSRPRRSISGISSKSQRCCARLNREQGVTMVLSTHDLNFAASLCRQLVLLTRRTGAGLRPDRTGADRRSRPGALRRGRRRRAITRAPAT